MATIGDVRCESSWRELVVEQRTFRMAISFDVQRVCIVWIKLWRHGKREFAPWPTVVKLWFTADKCNSLIICNAPIANQPSNNRLYIYTVCCFELSTRQTTGDRLQYNRWARLLLWRHTPWAWCNNNKLSLLTVVIGNRYTVMKWSTHRFLTDCLAV
jgi:hypothetical protein